MLLLQTSISPFFFLSLLSVVAYKRQSTQRVLCRQFRLTRIGIAFGDPAIHRFYIEQPNTTAKCRLSQGIRLGIRVRSTLTSLPTSALLNPPRSTHPGLHHALKCAAILNTLAGGSPVTSPLTISFVSVNAEELPDVSRRIRRHCEVPFLVLIRDKRVLESISGSDAVPGSATPLSVMCWSRSRFIRSRIKVNHSPVLNADSSRTSCLRRSYRYPTASGAAPASAAAPSVAASGSCPSSLRPKKPKKPSLRVSPNSSKAALPADHSVLL